MSDKEVQTPNTPRKRRRLPIRLAIGVAIIAAALWFAPSIVALTSLRQSIVPLALPDLAAKVNIGSASLGWFSSIRLGQVTIQDSNGEPLAEGPSIVLDKSLVTLLLNTSDLGTIRLDQPHVHLALREGGSNLEDALAKFFEGESTGTKISCRVEVAQGTIDLVDEAGHQGRLDEVSGTADFSQAAEKNLTVQISGRAVSTDSRQGVLNLEAKWQSSADPKIGLAGSGSATVKGDRVPLEALSPAASRLAKSLSIGGELTCDARLEWSEGGATGEYELDSFDARSVRLSARQWIGRDELACESLQARGKATLDQGRLQLTGLQLESELGDVQVTGAARIEELSSGNLLGSLTQDDLRLKGRVDLARLAQVLPATLKIREGTQITSGEIDFNLSSQAGDGSRSISGKLEANRLAAVNGGRQITWDQPIVITLAARNSDAGPVIEKLEGQASFMRISGQGSLAAGSLAATGDLDRLAAELGQFVDLDEYELAGKMQAGLQWKQGEQEGLAATGNVLVENFQCVLPGARPWREQRLTAALSASGLVDGGQLTRLDRGAVQIRAGADELDASLTEVIKSPSAKTAWPLKCRLVGSLGTWLPRVQAVVPLSGWAVGGGIDLNATATVSPERIEISQGTATLTKLQAWGNGLFIYEPELVIETSGTWDQVKRELSSEVTTLAGSAVALRADNVLLRYGAAGLSLSGDVDYRGDVARLYSWTYDPRQPPPRQFFGGLTGKLKAQHEGSVTRADFSANFTDLVLARRKQPTGGVVGIAPGTGANQWESLWSEKKVTLSAAGDYDEKQDLLQVSQFDIGSGILNLNTKGEIAKLTSDRRIDIKGDLGYDLPGLATLLRPYVGNDFALTGRDTRKFFLRGPLPDSLFAIATPAQPVGNALSGAAKPGVPATPASVRAAQPAPFPSDLTGEAGLGWTSAQVQGLAIGQGELQAKLADGMVLFNPLDLPLAEGRLKLAPQISLKSNPMLLSVEKGRILDQVRISPEMCQTWLKYVAPLLADATRAEGRFTLDLAGAAFPLADPEAGKAQGTLTVHEAQIGPGPLGQQALWIANQVKGLVERKPLGAVAPSAGGDFLSMPDQAVAFQLINQRVYHENLTFLVRDVTIRTKGSVGLDQSLSIVAEVPVLDRWVEKDRLLAGLKGQTLHIPITGTLSQPKLDGRIFEEASKRIISGAAGNLLEGELNKGLQKLFGPKK